MRIIAVDDERISLEVIGKSIRIAEPNAEVFSFSTSVEAIEFLKEHVNSIEVAFLDIEMRDMLGIELAKSIKTISPKTNIIFVTGYSQYMGEAFEMHASGYVNKPATPELIRKELDNLRYMWSEETTKRVKAHTFGNFEFFIDNKPIKFKFARTKELLAYLIDRQGAACNTAELCAILFEDRAGTASSHSHFRALISDLVAVLRENGMEDLFLKTRNSFAIDTSLIDCDLYKFLKDDISVIELFAGEYMMPYAWAEQRAGWLEGMRQKYLSTFTDE